MFCEKCGNQLNQHDTFCNKCGNRISGNAQPIPTYNATYQSNATSGGSTDNNSNNPYTGHSSGSSGSVYTDMLYSDNNNPPSRRPLIITLAVCGAILIALIAIIVLLIGGKNNDPDYNDNYDQNISQYDDDDEGEISEDDNIIKIEHSTIDNIIENGCDYTQFGVYVYNIKTRNEFCYNADKTFLASAMGQIVILDTLSRAASDKDIDIEHEYVHFDYLPNGKEAPNSKNQDGDVLSIKECVEDVAIYGDNNKSNLIVDYIASIYNEDNGFDVINRMLSSNGYETTEINRKTFINSAYIDYSVGPNITTAKEIGSIYHSLLYNSGFGSSSYMKNIFKSISAKGDAIGLKKFVPSYYDVYNVNALTAQCTNNVAYISDGETELIVAILSETQEDKTKIENNDTRENIQGDIIEHIIETQFED